MTKLFLFLFYISKYIPLSRGLFNTIYSCEIPKRTIMGKNVAFMHNARGTIIHGDSVIGNNVTIGHHVCIGTNATPHDAPIIHDNVFIGVYSLIIGKVEIGEGAVIGAGSLVMHDIPANMVYYNPRTEHMEDKSTISNKSLNKIAEFKDEI